MSLTAASVDPFAQQVDVTQVAGVLLDHPDQHLPQRHRPSAAAVLIAVIVSGDVKTGCLLDPLGGEADLRVPGVPRLLELCEQAAGWLQDKGVRQWLPGEVSLDGICQQVDDGQ